ncbi:hypothetical protein BX661DRAFT_177093 [Kickxella alabastrina]|uniref:uncharacterized protein n=1 Tax=Kickxella alabastrina TaxID=61397 RepID=UPI00221F229F|nr:uncharacterized protein BX661DRAFT_177093 [Kickxella alabastrina]KAI7834371.1 hypothetical protein BX661DRAFT_177093 [Kickxella alabastrina]
MAKSRLKHEIDNADIESTPAKRARIEQDQTDAPSQEITPEPDVSRNKTGVTRLRGKQAQGSQAGGPEIGIVECVELVDFMCHEKASVKLCPKVNFITGQNGSGKSAILTALIIALGGKATTTNRAGSLKGFIREGCQRAIVRVELRNRGADAYRPDIYGNSIIIERQLRNSSAMTSQFKIMNGDTNAVVSRKKEDVVNITDYMAIQVDNPINILSQDAAREFLASTSPDKMYLFFLKGTQLFQLSEDLEAVRQAIARAESSIERKKEVLPEMRAEKKRWEQHYQDMRQARDISANMTELSQQLAWAYVEDAEAKLQESNMVVDNHNKKISKIEEKIEAENTAIIEIDAEAEEIREQAERHLAQLVPLEAEKSGPMTVMAQIRAALISFKETENEINNEARSTRQRTESLKKEIASERARLHEKDQGGKEQLKQTIASLEDLQSDQLSYEERSKELNEMKGNCIREVDKNRIYVEKTQQNLDDLRRQTSNRLNAFGRGVPEAIAQIKNTRWKGMQPIGPLGEFVKVRDQKWSPIIETTLDKSLNAFLVDSYADQATLDKIFRQVGCQSRIVICKPELFDYSNGEPSAEYLTILRALEISNELVKRQLINLNRIEQIILVEQRALGDKIMVSNNGGFPRNVTACLTVDGFSVGSRSGGLSTQSVNLIKNTNRLVIAREEHQLSEQKRALDDAKRTLEKTEHELRDLMRKHELSKSEVRKCKGSSTNRKTRDLLHSSESTKIAELESELERLTAQMESIQTQQLGSEIALVDKKIEAIRAQATKLKNAADAKTGESRKHTDNIVYWKTKYSGMGGRLKELEKNQVMAREEVQSVMADACKLSEERVEVQHPATKLDRMITECNARLLEIERSSSMSLAEVSEKAQNYINTYNKAKDELRTTTRMMHFTNHLYQRGYTGKLEFDHSLHTLVPKVQTDQDLIGERAANGGAGNGKSSAAYQRKDTKSLSGGEKSFTTICLLLSLWETMNCPMMIDSARSKNETQFILITPLDMSTKPDADITILRLQPPNRQSSGT